MQSIYKNIKIKMRPMITYIYTPMLACIYTPIIACIYTPMTACFYTSLCIEILIAFVVLIISIFQTEMNYFNLFLAGIVKVIQAKNI